MCVCVCVSNSLCVVSCDMHAEMIRQRIADANMRVCETWVPGVDILTSSRIFHFFSFEPIFWFDLYE